MQFGVSESITHWAKYRPDRIAVHHNSEVTSFRELDNDICKLATKIDEARFSGERVGIAVKSKYELLVSVVSVIRAGKSAVILNTGLSNDAIEINLRDADVFNLIHDEFFENIRSLLSAGTTNAINVRNVFTNLESKKLESPTGIRQPYDEWGVLFSSGTTGAPKGIVRDHNSIVTELLGWCLELGLGRNSSFYIGRPIFYTGGLVLAFSTLLVSGRIILNDLLNDNDPVEVWADYQKCCSESKVSWAFFIPDQIREFIRLCQESGHPPYGASMLLLMGGPISGQEKIRAAEVLGSGVVESWGNTESLGTITEPDDLKIRPDSIGRPFLTDELYVVDENARILKANEIGKLAGNEEAGFAKYCNRPEATNRVKQRELIISEDLGYMDLDGFFYIRGREQDCVVVNGETLFLSDLEAKLRNQPRIRECCIVATPLDDSSLELVAIVVPSGTQVNNHSEFLNAMNNLLVQNERLKRVIFIESMPRLPSGKVDKLEALAIAKRTG